ncbi:MAG: molecular chaperone DnaJ [Pseudomonadota bacterium]
MSKPDYYATLGVAKTASEKELKAAFRKLAMKHHPDKNPGDAAAEAKFKEAGEAYDVLRDAQKRAAYDRFGHAAFANGSAGPGGPGGGFGQDFGASMSDIFEEVFGFAGGARGRTGGRARTRTPRGQDLRYDMEITLEDAYHGKEAEIDVPSAVSCETCSGSGAKPGTSTKTCDTCGGIGQVRAQQGFFSIQRTCPTCSGTGEIIETPCEVCNGQGRVMKERTLQINVPAGVEDGTRIRLTGEGEAGPNGSQPGDLYIFLSVKPHEVFQRDGADLFCRVPVSMATAALGGQLEVPTLDGGRTRIRIPEGTQTGRQFRLRGKGMPILRSSQGGDMFIQVAVETPTKLTRRQRELLEEFEAASSDENHPEATGFFSKVARFFEGADDEARPN